MTGITFGAKQPMAASNGKRTKIPGVRFRGLEIGIDYHFSDPISWNINEVERKRILKTINSMTVQATLNPFSESGKVTVYEYYKFPAPIFNMDDTRDLFVEHRMIRPEEYRLGAFLASVGKSEALKSYEDDFKKALVDNTPLSGDDLQVSKHLDRVEMLAKLRGDLEKVKPEWDKVIDSIGDLQMDELAPKVGIEAAKLAQVLKAILSKIVNKKTVWAGVDGTPENRFLCGITPSFSHPVQTLMPYGWHMRSSQLPYVRINSERPEQ